MSAPQLSWPGGADFAFTVFDDTDLLTLENGPPVYDFLASLGFRTTKSVWPCRPDPEGAGDANRIYDFDIGGDTCEDPGYLDWVQRLQRGGFEIGLHNASYVSSRRETTERALERFREWFGSDPRSFATHFQCVDGIYWGSERLTGVNRLAYNLLNRFRTHGVFKGHVPGSEYFWGDLCLERIDYVRNFVFRDINTLKACPEMPYHDADRQFVRAWFASSEGGDVRRFNRLLAEANQDRLEAEGGACIIYTHFGKGFLDGGRLDPDFERLMTRLSRKKGWFVPVATLLDFIAAERGIKRLTSRERAALERRWIVDKILAGGGS